MRPRDEFLDYEPLRRTKPRAFTEDAPLRKPSPARPLEAKPEREAKPEPKPLKETWIHKHGHTVSYIGVFLFTTIVFFRPYEFSPSLFWLSTSAFWVAVATTIVYVVTQLGLENKISARPRELKLVLLLALLGALSIPQASQPSRALTSWTTFLKVILIFIVIVNVVRTEKRLKKLWILVLIATCILSVSAIHDYQLGRFLLMGQRIKGAIGGLFDNPNDLALHLVTMLPIALALCFGARYVFTKIVYLVTSLLIVGGIVVTFSRGGFLALVAVGGVLLWRMVRSSRWLIPPVGAVLIAGFIVFAPGVYKQRLSTTGDESSMARFDDLKRSAYVATRHPILGVGMDNYILFSNSNKASHNAYTQVAAEIGAAAAILYILFILAPFKGLRNIEHKSYEVQSHRRYYYYAIALQASLVGYMVASFFASVAYLWYIYYLVGYAVCLRRIYDAAVESDMALNSSSQS